MERIEIKELKKTTGRVKERLLEIKQEYGIVKNVFGALANSSSALEGFVQLQKILSQGSLSHLQREQLAVAIAGFNGARYCAASHNHTLNKLGIADNEVQLNLLGESTDAQTQAMFRFAYKVISKKGHVNVHTLNEVKYAGFTEEQIVEIIAHIALSTFSNFFNEVFTTPIDVPVKPAVANLINHDSYLQFV